ncbi:bacteriocin, lactobin A family protein [Bacillus cereus]|uniref:bacteriocin, lactobin A family protein n=1 Tax=Bacillus cereus group TaxID=86661 RepID=UPI000BEC6C8D|nr:bacteriocin, lactobin A family protein [Bacillus toyonensis]PDY85339.1 bacteriocin, lactobin A family protein [Bacillus toyonensis]
MEFLLNNNNLVEELSLDELEIDGGGWAGAVSGGLGVAGTTAWAGAEYGASIGLVGGPAGAAIGGAAGALVGGVIGYYAT